MYNSYLKLQMNYPRSTPQLFSTITPMDNEVLDEAQVRKIDAAIEKGAIVPRYASVPVSQIIPESVNYNILTELFIPDDYSDEYDILKTTTNPTVSSLRSQGLAEKLVDEAFRITGHNSEKGEIGIQASSWRPSGKIRVWDKTKYNWVGTEGVKIKANRWFTTHTGFVLSDGTFSCDGTFKRPANYSFNWDRHDFEIWGGTSISSVGINGPKKEGPWNLDIQGGVQEFYGTIFRAAFHYYYQNNLGLRRPPQNSFWKTKLKLGAVYEANSEINGNFAFWRGFANLGTVIKIYNPQRNTRDIYGTVIHEIAHASHWNFSPVRKDFTSADLNVAESFARGVQWALTRLTYPGYVPQYTRKSYTGMVQDLVDGAKRVESDFYYDGNTSVILYREYQDRVSGYTLRQIEDQLIGTRTWDVWKNKLISAYSNPTESYIYDTFNYWNQM